MIVKHIHPAKRIVSLTAVIFFMLYGNSLYTQIIKTPEEFLKEEFPGASIQRRSVYIAKEDLADLEKIAGEKFQGRLFAFHAAAIKGTISGYAVFDTHRVRTKEETLCIVFTPEGNIRKVQLISFYEPEDYIPSVRWLKQFLNRKDADSVTSDNIAGITGATLTTQAVMGTVRKSMVVFQYGILKNRKVK